MYSLPVALTTFKQNLMNTGTYRLQILIFKKFEKKFSPESSLSLDPDP
jgi:hypothetical protein